MENTGGDLLPRDRSARGDEVGVGRHAQEHRVDSRARDGAPVVRRSRDDAVVGRHLAERRLRDLDGEQAARRGAPRVEHRRRRSAREPDRARPRLAEVDAADSRRRRRRRRRSTRRSTPSPTRRARRCCACSRATSAPRRSARASTPTCRRTPTATRPRRTSRSRSRRASGKPVERILPTFVNQPGVPLLDVSLACANGQTAVTLKQQRFVDRRCPAPRPGGGRFRSASRRPASRAPPAR